MNSQEHQSQERLSRFRNAQLASNWTAIIAAAGRGVRLEYDKPKILFEVAGRTLLDHLVSLLQPFVGRFVVVLSPSGAAAVEPLLNQLCPRKYRVAMQYEASGMADAVAAGAALVETPNTLVIWGDQVAVKPESVAFCMRVLEENLDAAAVCPTVVKHHPYIHFLRDRTGRIRAVLQRREGDSMPDVGEGDSGIFFFRSPLLREYLDHLLTSRECEGKLSGERNFLPIFPLIDTAPGRLLTPEVMSEIEAIGINSRADAALIESCLAAQSAAAK